MFFLQKLVKNKNQNPALFRKHQVKEYFSSWCMMIAPTLNHTNRTLMIRFFFFLCFTLLATFSAIGQDFHFTQFYAAPLQLNPALTGGTEGLYRFSINYRDQWRQALDNPHTTTAAALDLRFPVTFSTSSTKDAAGIGISFFNDRVPKIGFSTSQLAISGAFHKSLNDRNNQYLSLGLQIGLNQRNVNYQNLTFEDQFDGSNGYTQATSEDLPPNNNFPFSDMAVGANYTYNPNRKFGLFLGGAIHHLFQPQVSFFYDRRNEDPERGDNRIYRKFTGHFSTKIPISNKMQLLPRAMFTSQGPHTALNVGSNIRIGLGEYAGSAMHIGGWVRPVSNEADQYELAAAIFMIGFEANNVVFGFSYDAGLSNIQSPFNQGAFELSVSYLGDYDNETILCPKF